MPSVIDLNLLLRQAVAAHKSGEVDEAARLYRRCLESDPHCLPALYYGGILALQQVQPIEAVKLFHTLSGLEPKRAEVWYQLGLAQQRCGCNIEAECSYREALACNPGLSAAGNTLALLLRARGALSEAVVVLRSLVRADPQRAEYWTNLGLALHESGNVPDAINCYRHSEQIDSGAYEVVMNLGCALSDIGDYASAIQYLRSAIARFPDKAASAYVNLGAVFDEMGDLEAAAEAYNNALRKEPDNTHALLNLGKTLQAQGSLEAAIQSYRIAILLDAEFAEAHSNLGIALKEQGKLEAAVESYRTALAIKPDFAEAHCTLGATLHNLGRLEEAEGSYRQALLLKPDLVDALNNLALLFNARGKPIEALNFVKQSLRIKETDEAKSIFVACIKHLHWTRDDSEIRLTMVRALTEPWGRPSDLARISGDLVKLKPDVGACIIRAADAWPARLPAQDLYGSGGLKTIAGDSLLCALLNSAPICDIELERFLTMARHAMLQAVTAMTGSDSDIGMALSLYSALARQCFINEYVFSHTDDEIRKASDLRDLLAAALETRTQVPVLWPVTVAAYFPLCSLPGTAWLLDAQWPKEVMAVLVQQVREPEEELRERSSIPRLTDIDDEVSLRVRNQYEENPYPRWVKTDPTGRSTNIVDYLCQHLPLAPIKRQSQGGSADFLIAGCGTGQHSIQTARQFPGARVLAVDLSISSLGYAKWKTRELGLTSIEYAHADILKLGALDRSFDVIESVGVLHHLADPLAGWRVLLSLLRPWGFMKLGFYSELARRNIRRARALIAGQGYGATANEIRRCRQEMMDLDKSADFGTALKSPDFFSMSTCRDLLFHVQEHHLTLIEIDRIVRDHNLAFLGFEIDADVLHAYKQKFPDDRAATKLDQWHMFETENPDVFSGMYVFWIQKDG